MENAKLDLKYTGRWGIIYNGYVSYIENCVSEMNLGVLNLYQRWILILKFIFLENIFDFFNDFFFGFVFVDNF